MKVHLNQQEIESAIISYVGNQGISITGKNVVVEMTAGRGEKGMSATVDISNEEIRVACHPASAEPHVEKDSAQQGLPFNQATPVAEAASETPDSDKPLFGN